MGEVGFGDMPPDNVGCHHAAACGSVHLFEEVDNSYASLTEACQDERTALIEMGEIMGKGFAYIGQGNKYTVGDKTVGGEGLQCTLPIIGREVVERA